MARTLNEIISEINNRLADGLLVEPNTFYNVSVLQPRDDGTGTKTWPMTRTSADNMGVEGQRIYPQDLEGMQFYHRIIDQENDTESGKGSQMYIKTLYSMRLIGVGYRPNVQNVPFWNNPEIANQVLQVLGTNAQLTGKEIFLLQGRPNTDLLGVLEQEYGDNQEFRTNVTRLVAFSVDYTIEQRIVGNGCFGLAAPTNFSFSNPANTTLDASCTSNSNGDEDGFQWFLSLDNINFNSEGITSTNVTNFQYTGLLENTLYFGKVKAIGTMDSPFSNTDAESTTEDSFDPWAQNWFDRVDTFGTGLTDNEKAAINTFAVSQRLAGNIDFFDEFFLWVLGATNSLVGALLKVASPVNFPIFGANGVINDGISSYVNTTFNANVDSTNYTQTDAMIGSFVYAQSLAANDYILGAFQGTSRAVSILYEGTITPTKSRLNGAVSSFAGSSIDPESLNVVTREDNINTALYENGVKISSVTGVGSIPNLEIFIGATNNNGSPTNFGSSTQQAFIIGNQSSIDQVSLETDLRILLTTLNAI